MDMTHLRQPSSRLERLLAPPAQADTRPRRPTFPLDLAWNVEVEIILAGE
jgi:hypothetical protein